MGVAGRVEGAIREASRREVAFPRAVDIVWVNGAVGLGAEDAETPL